MTLATSDITQLLSSAREGDQASLERLLPLVYDDLRRMAGNQMRGERSDHTLQATALVHEAYLRLAGRDVVSAANRQQFYALAGRAMRQILVDHARRRKALKRRGGELPPGAGPAAAHDHETTDTLLTIDDALERLAGHDALMAKIVEAHFFAGLTMPETAQALGIALRTAERKWRVARAWLQHELDESAAGSDQPLTDDGAS